MDNLFTIKQVSFILKVHPLSVRRYIKDKKLEAVKIGGAVRVKEDQLQKFQRQYTVGERSKSDKTDSPPSAKKIFSFADPIWRLDGISMSLSLPDYDN